MNNIKIYTVNGCPYCVELKELLTKENIEFTEVNASLPENRAECEKLFEVTKSDDVPVVKIGPRLLVPGTSFQTIQEAFETTKKFLA